MSRKSVGTYLFASVLIGGAALPATAQSFRVQCPTSTITHTATSNDLEPAYTAATTFTTSTDLTKGYQVPSHVNGAIKCQQISGGDGYATMGDGTQTYMFSFGPLSGLANIAAGLPGTVSPAEFNQVYRNVSCRETRPPPIPAWVRPKHGHLQIQRRRRSHP